MSEPNPNLKMPSWLIYALVGKVVLLVAIAAAVLYFTGSSGMTRTCLCRWTASAARVRFRIQGELKDPSICHCRIVPEGLRQFLCAAGQRHPCRLRLDAGAPKYFASSNYVKRGFCGNCGTPLSYEAPDGVGVAIGAFDEPARVRPVVQFGVEAKIAYVDHLHELPARDTMDDIEAAPFLTDIESYQHPDHDTDDWTPREGLEPDHWRPKEQAYDKLERGCQCGRIRYRSRTRPASPHLCFCRMCQKAVGNYFAALGGVSLVDFEFTRGEPAWFHSSDIVRRGFCRDCGTPLFYQEIGGDHVAVLLGTLDDPCSVAPEWQSDTYGKPRWFAGLDTLPDSIGDETPDEQATRYGRIANTNHQHPDHDTSAWPLETSQ